MGLNGLGDWNCSGAIFALMTALSHQIGGKKDCERVVTLSKGMDRALFCTATHTCLFRNLTVFFTSTLFRLRTWARMRTYFGSFYRKPTHTAILFTIEVLFPDFYMTNRIAGGCSSALFDPSLFTK